MMQQVIASLVGCLLAILSLVAVGFACAAIDSRAVDYRRRRRMGLTRWEALRPCFAWKREW